MDQMGKVVSEDAIQELLLLAKAVLERREQESAHRSQSSLSLFEMNGQQCTRLWNTIRVVYDCFSECSTMSWVDPTEGLAADVHRAFALIVKDFYVAITRADAIKHYFSNERQWLEAAAVHRGVSRDAFLGVYEALSLCVKLLQKIAGDLLLGVDFVPSPKELEDEYQADVDSFRFALRLWYQDAREVFPEESDIILLTKYVLEREEKTSQAQVREEELLEFYKGKSEHPCTYVSEIGGGAGGFVFKVLWLGMTCARKSFNTFGMSSEGAIKFEQNFEREVGFLMKLDHPHILQLLCLGLKPQKYFISEFMTSDLEVFIKARLEDQEKGVGRGREAFTFQAALDLMLQTARGLRYLHAHGIVHRDLKPKNILVTPLMVPKLRDEGYADVKLADFGLTRTLDRDLTVVSRPNIGTTPYRAPEAFAAGEKIDWKKADTYSFAIVCFEILSGERPFKSIPTTTLHSHLLGGGRPRLPESCPMKLAALLKDCWHTSTDIRPSFTEITAKLEALKEEHILSNLASLDVDEMPLQRIVEEGERTMRIPDDGGERNSRTVDEDELVPENGTEEERRRRKWGSKFKVLCCTCSFSDVD